MIQVSNRLNAERSFLKHHNRNQVQWFVAYPFDCTPMEGSANCPTEQVATKKYSEPVKLLTSTPEQLEAELKGKSLT